MKETIQIEVQQSPHQVLSHCAKIVTACKAALADGFQAGQDLPVAITALVVELPGIIAAAPQLKPELLEDHMAFHKGVMVGAMEVVEALVK
jgi:hypothetical protein